MHPLASICKRLEKPKPFFLVTWQPLPANVTMIYASSPEKVSPSGSFFRTRVLQAICSGLMQWLNAAAWAVLGRAVAGARAVSTHPKGRGIMV